MFSNNKNIQNTMNPDNEFSEEIKHFDICYIDEAVVYAYQKINGKINLYCYKIEKHPDIYGKMSFRNDILMIAQKGDWTRFFIPYVHRR